MLGACQLTDDQWTFKLTREAERSGYWSLERTDAPLAGYSGTGPGALLVVGAFVLAPPILDLAFLPVAGVHDLLFLR